ncbi:MAG: hypothetical protein AAGI37_08975 [Planctomycetota bacterium]
MTDQPVPASDSSAPLTPDTLVPGSRVRITKQVAREGTVPTNSVEGIVVKAEQRKTGSWFAHAKDDRLWLDRLEITKDDGEIYICNVDAHTVIEVIPMQGGTDGA